MLYQYMKWHSSDYARKIEAGVEMKVYLYIFYLHVLWVPIQLHVWTRLSQQLFSETKKQTKNMIVNFTTECMALAVCTSF